MGNCLKCWNSDSSEDVQQARESRQGQQEPRRVRYPGFLENDPILHPTPGVSRPMSQLTEEEQVKIATRMGLIATLPLFIFDEGKREKLSECIICMCEYEEGEELRYLPCLHTYHRVCIDDWLMRALTCPSCLEEIRPSSPSVPRNVVDLVSQLVPTFGAPSGPPSYGNSQSISTPPIPEVATSAAEATTWPDAEAPRDSQNRGDSLSATLQDPWTDHTSNQDPDRSLTSSNSCAKSTNTATINNNSHGSGGDCLSLTATRSAVPPQPYPDTQHRRTRSTEHGTNGSRTATTREQLGTSVGGAQRLHHYRRRGHSVTGADWSVTTPGGAAVAPEAATRTHTNRSSFGNRSATGLRQLDGDSGQSSFP